MKVENIPWALFKEFREKYGLGEVRDLTRDAPTMAALAPLDPAKAGFEGAIVLKINPTVPWAGFYLLSRMLLEPEEWPYPSAVQVTAGPSESGVWAYGRGEHITHRLNAELAYRGLNLITSPAAPLAIEALKRAHELVSSPELEQESYWQSERAPGTYEEP